MNEGGGEENDFRRNKNANKILYNGYTKKEIVESIQQGAGMIKKRQRNCRMIWMDKIRSFQHREDLIIKMMTRTLIKHK